jgi:hypothetical protein
MTIERCLDEDGRIFVWPMKKHKSRRGPLLDMLAEQIPVGEKWTEKQVNEAIKAKIATMDHVYFRRVLIETRRLERTPYGDAYGRP